MLIFRCNVKRLYLLLRLKKQKTPEQRLQESFTTAIFDRLAKLDPNYFDRITVINGDVQQLNLGISPQDIQLLNENVEITLHVAANVRFDCPLAEICLVNVRGTREILRIAKDFKKLIAFVYISTAYCHSHTQNRSTKEQYYKPPIDPNEMIKICEHYENHPDFDIFTTLRDKFISPWPNTYSFSKALTEELVRRAGSYLPIVVIRPSIGKHLSKK